MKSALFRARGSMRVQQQLTRVRELRDRWIDRPLKDVEHARRRLLEEDVDVLVLGDSSTLSWSVRDHDRTLIPELLGRRLGPNVVSVAGPGYGPAVYSEVLRILGILDRRPAAVVAAIAIRTCGSTPVTRHPVMGYPRSLEALSQVTRADRRIRSFGRGGTANSPSERAAFMALHMRTRWGGDLTIGEYRKRLEGQGPPPWPREIEAFRFDYFHGEEVRPDHPNLEHVTELGRRMEEYGVPAVAYWTRPPLQRGELHFPGEFEAHVRANAGVIDSALLAGSAKVPPMLDVHLEDDEYEDSQNAAEHYALAGRVKITDAVADALSSSA